MTANGCHNVVWLEDEPGTIREVVKYLNVEKKMEVKIFEESKDVLQTIKKQIRTDLIILDLDLRDEDGIDFAFTMRGMNPSIPIISVTQYFNKYAQEIARANLANLKRPFPIIKIWEKGDLETPAGKRIFAEEIDSICQSEFHQGVVTRMEPDYMEVVCQTPHKQEYIRLFDAKFLEKCGVERAGDQLGLFFWRAANGAWGQTAIQIWVLPRNLEQEHKEAEGFLKKLNMQKIREKFPSAMLKKK